MIKQKVILALLLCIIVTSSTFAQLSKVKRARIYMEELNYMGAIELYNQILDKDDNPEAKINIAEAYRKVNDSENAEYWYGQVVQLADAEPIQKLYYGQMLQRNGKCDLAKEWYQAYVDAIPEDQRGQYLVQACDYEDELRTKNAGIYEIVHVDFNSNLDDFSPAYYDDGLVFASERDKGVAIVRTTEWTGNPFNELFQVKRQKEGKEPAEYTYEKPEKYSKKLNSKFHDASVTYNKDQSKIYFTRNNIMNGKVGKDDDGIIRLKVFSATIADDEWKDLEGLPFNSDEYSVAHPTLTTDGTKMYFSSDMPGGFGGMDLYMTTMDGGSWGPPINLGARINTEGNEIFPYFDSHSKRLYFGSNGHVGLGGIDIYYMDDKGEDQFGEVTNMGYPLNTISDDFGIIFGEEGKEGYFTSDREGGVGRDDIYAFRKSAATMEILVIDEATGEPIPGATVLNDCTGTEMMTNTEGKIMFDIKMDVCCNFKASIDEYLDNEKEGCTKSVDMGQKVFVEIPLKKEVLFNLDVFVVDPTTGNPIEGAMVMLTNDCEGAELEAVYTDSTGTLSFELIEDCCYTVTAKKEGYFGSPVENQCTRDLTEPTTLQAIVNLSPISAPVADVNPNNPNGTDPNEYDPTNEGGIAERDPNLPTYDAETGLYIDPESGEPANKTVGNITYEDGEIKDGGVSPTWEQSPTEPGEEGYYAYLLHIYYDFDQSYLRDEAQPEINKLCKMMTENSDLIIEIASHTDSRGSFRYNRSLSQRRAESVVRALMDCGIAEERLVARGYGEKKNVNNCANRIPCSEREHQMNRRTEFRIIGCLSCSTGESLSKENLDTKVDECASCPF
ncbi:MAG: outer membrane protein OmpA-like peptidoglycan-associated protein [Ulvibacter sp.]|jgi:outer membrane protein OmpA-like peptidoglycan-associated protein/tetratricopeptide (TPR) repeat protein